MKTASRQDVTSSDVNDYLKEITGKGHHRERFPDLGGNGPRGDGAERAEELRQRGASQAQSSRRHRKASQASLGNTPTICRKCYVHPEVLNSYIDGNLVLQLKSKAESELRGDVESLNPEEAAVLALLRRRLAKEAERPGAKKPRARAA